MSSTQMDFSPTIIDRKQDITSWPEGEIARLTTRDQNRYRKRKDAVIEYFQSELSIDEITSRHHLAQSDSLTTLLRRCCMQHKDGRPWGFRALVPGVRVVDHSASARAEKSSAEPPDEIEDDDATAERPAIKLSTSTVLPETPRPAVEEDESEENATELEKREAEADAKNLTQESEVTSPSDARAEQVEAPATLAVGEVPEEVEQAELPAAASVPAEETEQAEAALEEETLNEPTAKLQDPQAQENKVAELASEQEETQLIESTAVAGQRADDEATSAAVSELTVPEQENESETLSETREDEEKSSTPELVSETAGDDVQAETESSTPESISKDERVEGEDDDAEAEVAQSNTVELKSEDEKEEARVADLDTVEVAKVRDERREHVAAVDTIVVPAAMLEALEKADHAAEMAEAETVETSAVSAQAHTADAQSPVEQTKPASPADEQNQEKGIVALPTQELDEQEREIQQAATQSLKEPTQGLVEEGRYRVTGSQAALKHSLLRRWARLSRTQRQKRWVRILSAAVVACLLVSLAIPLCVGLIGYSTYNNIKGVASDGVNNLLAIKDLMPANKNDLTAVLNTQKLTTAQNSLSKAQSDFLQLQDMVNRPDVQSLLQQFAPQYSGKLDMARHLVQVALDVTRMGQELIGVAQMGAGILHGGSLLSSSSNKPLLTSDDINKIEAALVHAQYYISDIQAQMSQVNLAQVPLGSAAQKAELAKYLGEIPQAQDTISQAQNLIGAVAWLLGVGSQRNYLVQTLDRGELRPSGGFEGQYGVLSINNGRMGSLSLHDIASLDYGNNGNELGNHAPPQYKWMDFGNFGVRDANLSADFPTTAKMVMQLFQLEGGGPVDGDIQFTPVLIEQLLQMTGPLHIKEYNETITAQNLEDKLHLYQQDYHYIDIQAAKTGTYTHQTRKAFTSLVGQLLLDRAKHLSTSQLVSFVKILFKDFKSRDLQVYFNNPVVEQWLAKNDDNGAMPHFTDGKDGFMVVQANISISKAAQFVHSTFNDQVTLNADGSATHSLTITLNYNQTGPVYGYDTYADYMRVYAPANAQFNYGYGFDSGHALCTPGGKGSGNGSGNGNGNGNGGGGTGTGTGKTTGCTQYNSYFPSNGARYCPNGVYTLGFDGMIDKPFPIDSLSGPTQMSSDLPGYQMWGGLTLTPKNCTSTITLQWTVPHIVQNKPGQSPYQMIVGHQAGWPDTAQVSVDASALKGVKNLSFNQTINVDTTIALPARPLPPSQKKPATPTPAVTPSATPKRS